MILGLGIDLLDVRRIERTIERFGDRFCDRLFTAGERRSCERGPVPSRRYALRYAAKEACSKALGTGFRQGVFWRDIVVGSLPSGKPTIELMGGARRRLEQLTPPPLVAVVDVSMSDEYPFAQAMVVISAQPVLPSC